MFYMTTAVNVYSQHCVLIRAADNRLIVILGQMPPRFQAWNINS